MKHIKFIFEILLFILTFLLIIFLPYIIRVKKIICVNIDGNCSERINEKLKDFQNLTLYDTKNKTSDLLKNDISVNKYYFQYKIDGSLILNIDEKKPKYSIGNERDSWKLLISKDGWVLSISESSPFPVLFVENKLPDVGTKVDDKIIFALKLLNGLSENPGINKADYKNNELVIDMNNGLNVIFPVEGDIDYLLGSYYLVENRLKKLSEDFKMDDLNYDTIDFRFKDPVLRK